MTSPDTGVQIDIAEESDIVTARTMGKEMARSMGFGMVDQTRIATGISELARNIIQYARTGLIKVKPIAAPGRQGLEIVAEDDGPGIPNVAAILDGTVRSSRGLGLGIPGTRRLMDEFSITSAEGQGTRVRCVKWL